MMKITMNPSYLTDKLVELGWDPRHIQMAYERIIAIAEQDEDYIDLSIRLNPAQRRFKQPWMPKVDRERAIRESPALDPALSARVRDARSHQRT